MAQAMYIGLQYFLLGVSGIYIAQNILMLAGFLPGKGTFFNKQYFRDLQELKNDHINRYSDEQVNILHMLFCVLFVGTAFALNHYYHILPVHLAIWTMFVVFPVISEIYAAVTRKKNYR